MGQKRILSANAKAWPSTARRCVLAREEDKALQRISWCASGTVSASYSSSTASSGVAADLQRCRAHRAAALLRSAGAAALHEGAGAVAADDEAGKARIRAGNRKLRVIAFRRVEGENAGAKLLRADEQRVHVQYGGAAQNVDAGNWKCRSRSGWQPN